ncbi:carboxylesterase 1C-like [Amphiura filiformis]|uniref:carboxylesterase 1C-like n=1 Tax=Amphiura filiformis TaxID=82378 RepID=UPI003B20DA3F
MLSLRQYFRVLWSLFLLLRLGFAQVQIETSSGTVRGALKNLDGEQYRAFLGIPYAEQPRRFAPSVPKSPWNDTLNTMQYGPSCPQDIVQISEIYDGRDYLFDVPESAKAISEDCLTLNVFTPSDMNPSGTEKHAVMVWVHGGEFQVGQGAAYNGAVLATRGSVVVVTFNYRLGPFGFLTTLDEYATGNYALLDQQLVLRWIQRDVSRFGGDPNRVTLFGQSTGGISASLHLFAPGSQELFHRVIAESSVVIPWNLNEGFREPVNLAREFGANAGNCNNFESNTDLIQCLRESDLQTLMDAWRIVKKHPWRITWGPVIDGEFLPIPSVDSSATDAYMVMDHDLLIGVNTLEGFIRQIEEINGVTMVTGDLTSGLSPKSWNTLLNSFLADFGDQQKLVASSVNQLYTDWDKYVYHGYGDDIARLRQALNLIGDMNSVVKVYEFLTSWISAGQSSNTFMYVFDHRTEIDSTNSLPGAFHSEELPYVWGAPFNAELMGYFTEDEEELSDTMMMYWTNFAKSGNPNQNPDQPAAANAINDLPTWPNYNLNDMSYMYLSANDTTNEDSVSARHRYRWQQIYFWTETIPDILEYSTCDKDECKIGEDDGWNLTPAQAVWFLNFLIGVCIFLVVVVMMTCAMACGYREAVKIAQYGSPKGKWGYLPKNKSVSTLQRETNDMWKLNHAFEPDEADTRL